MSPINQKNLVIYGFRESLSPAALSQQGFLLDFRLNSIYINIMSSRSVFSAAGHKFRTKNISKRVQKVVISPIKEMSILADDLRERTRNKIISFGQGIPHFDTPSYIKNGIKTALKERDTGRYTLEPGIRELRELVAKYLQKSRGIKKIDGKKEIMISSGCQEAVACAIATVIDPGDEILLFSPSYPSYQEQILQWSGKPIFVPLVEKMGWNMDLGAVEKRITKKTKALIFSNPSNPTGAVLSEGEVAALSKIAKKHNLIIITDEAYDFLTYEGEKHFSPSSFPGLLDRVILCGSFSKKYAMTGYRVGYAFADRGILDHMLKIHDALTICAPAISQKAVISALQDSEKEVGNFVDKLTKNRELMCRELDKLKGVFEYHKPKGAYYIFARYKTPRIDSFKLALKILYQAKVIVIPGVAFGPTGENHLRFSFAGQPLEIKEGFKRLRTWFKKHGI